MKRFAKDRGIRYGRSTNGGETAVNWYDYIAKRNGGYRVRVPYDVEGESAEDVFERELIGVTQGKAVLDAGCGHGEFTLKMARHARSIVGYDFSQEMIHIANRLKQEQSAESATFVKTAWREQLPFPDGAFDVVYSRRGPGSIVEQSRLLKPGGIVMGIHIYPIPDGEIVDRIAATGAYENITRRVYQTAVTYLRNEADFAEYLSSMHMAPDYTLPENRDAFAAILKDSYIGGRIGIRESKQIWRATRSK